MKSIQIARYLRPSPALFACGVALLLLAVPRTLLAQEAVVITAQQPQLEKFTLGSGLPTDPGSPPINLATGQEIMLWVASGQTAVVIQGPASFTVVDDTLQIKFNIESGRFLVTAGQVDGDQPVHFSAGPEEDRQFDLPAPPGTTVIVRSGSDVDIGWLEAEGRSTQSIALLLLGEDAELTPNEHISIRGGAAARGKAADWMQDGGIVVTTADGLGFNSAKSRRGEVCSQLFSSLAYWDKTAQKNPDLLLPTEPDSFTPEVRTVTAQINASPNTFQSAPNTRRNVTFSGANEVPGTSPAAISVGGAGGVARNNAEARSLLSLTGSQGLGFNGLSLLGIRGTSAGIRTPGPAGLGGP